MLFPDLPQAFLEIVALDIDAPNIGQEKGILRKGDHQSLFLVHAA